jgi:hypothetical protein
MSFSPSESARIHAQAMCHFLLGYAEKATIVDYSLSEVFGSLLKGTYPKNLTILGV